MLKHLLCIFLFTIASGLCSAQTDTPQADSVPKIKTASSLIDYPIGKKWVYRKTKASGDEKPVIETSEVVGVHQFSGKQWVLLNDFGMAIWSRVDENGVHDATVLMDEETLLLDLQESHLFFKFPTDVGDEIETTYKDEREFGGGTWVKTSALDKTVETPAGKYSCIVYEIWSKDTDDDEKKLIMKHYLCPKVGIVKIEEAAEYAEDGIASIWELMKIELSSSR